MALGFSPPKPIDPDAVRAGDALTWAEIFRAHGPALLGYATRMLGRKERAEEIVQESLVRAYRSRERFEGRSSVKGWLFRIVHNAAIDDIRRAGREVPVGADPEQGYFDEAGHWSIPGRKAPPARAACPDWSDRAEREMDAKRMVVLVRQQFDALPHRHREVLLLRELHGLESAEICDTLEISPGNLRVRLHRARIALRAALVESGQV